MKDEGKINSNSKQLITINRNKKEEKKETKTDEVKLTAKEKLAEMRRIKQLNSQN
jgi:hypothetical protein